MIEKRFNIKLEKAQNGTEELAKVFVSNLEKIAENQQKGLNRMDDDEVKTNYKTMYRTFLKRLSKHYSNLIETISEEVHSRNTIEYVKKMNTFNNYVFE